MFLGIDVGTTAIKFAMIQAGQACFTNSVALFTYGDDTIKYQKPTEIIAAIKQGLLEIPLAFRQKCETIAISCAMHSLWLEDSEALFLWSDLQAADVIEEFKKDRKKATHFYQLTGTPIHAMSPFAKILFLKEQARLNEPTQILGLKELVLRFFTGETIIDYSTASATGLFDLDHLNWSLEILTYLGVKVSQLATTVDTTAIFPITPKTATQFSFAPTVKIMAGASDGCLAALASFCATGRRSSLSIGTSAAVRQLVERPLFDGTAQNFCYYLNQEHYVIGAPSNNGGCVLDWCQRVLAIAPTLFFEQIPHLLSETPIGSHGVRFTPFLNGERAPLWDNRAIAGFTNVTLATTREDLIRATIEGMLLNIDRLTQIVAPNEPLSVSGGFFKTEALGQLAADILGVPCYFSAHNEPVFGLYDLFRKSNFSTVQNEQSFLPESIACQQYASLKQKM